MDATTVYNGRREPLPRISGRSLASSGSSGTTRPRQVPRFGERLRATRRRLGLSYADAAARLRVEPDHDFELGARAEAADGPVPRQDRRIHQRLFDRAKPAMSGCETSEQASASGGSAEPFGQESFSQLCTGDGRHEIIPHAERGGRSVLNEHVKQLQHSASQFRVAF